jgi:hypothetical protein
VRVSAGACGDVLVAGKLAEAIKAYQDGLKP